MNYFKKFLYFFLVFISFELLNCKSIENYQVAHKVNKNDKIVDIFMFDDYFQQVLINFLFLNKSSTVDNLSDSCNQNLKMLVFSIIADKEWALRGEFFILIS
jgi:hypothetical protein